MKSKRPTYLGWGTRNYARFARNDILNLLPDSKSCIRA